MDILRNNNHPKVKKFKTIDEELQGFWRLDNWDVRLSPILKGKWIHNANTLHFENIIHPIIRNEIKYYLFKRLTSFSLSPISAWRNHALVEIGLFLRQQYPTITSISDIEKEIMLPKFKNH